MFFSRPYSTSVWPMSVAQCLHQYVNIVCRPVWGHSTGQCLCQRWGRLGCRRQNFLFCQRQRHTLLPV